MKKHNSFFCCLALLSLAASCSPSGGGEASSSESQDDNSSASSIVNVYGENNIVIHFYKAEGDYSSYALWLWPLGGSGSEYTFTGSDAYGAYAIVPIAKFTQSISTFKLGTIVKSAGSWNYQTGDLTADFSLASIDEFGNAPIWLKYNDSEIYYSEPSHHSFDKLEFDSLTSINVSSGDAIVSMKLKSGDKTIKESVFDSPMKKILWSLGDEFEIDFASTYKAEATFEDGQTLEKTVSISSLYDSKDFNDKYAYDGLDLGATYSKERTVFKVWSPSSTSISLRIYDNGTPKSVSSSKGDDTHKDVAMVKGEKGVWSVSIEGDLEGNYYTFVVNNGVYVDKEIVDPMAKSAGVNGLRGMIVDFSKTNPEGWDEVAPKSYDRKELVVYETHVADVSSSSTWNGTSDKSKRYLGLCEEGTSFEKEGKVTPTGFDYIKSLGVNAVQLQPIFDQDNDEVDPTYNWGYNPLNYNALEGSYSSDPYDGYTRIKEFKEVVKAYSNAGINIIMDVVYNHVASVSGRNFDVLAPGYFFRYKTDGSFSNGSGCGNDTASERAMFANFMTQSTTFWAQEYKLGGFRFDLMGLHTLSSMDQVTKALEEINPNIVVYGEPWTLTTSTDQELATQPGIAKHMNEEGSEVYGAFNDGFRDAMIKGGMKGTGEVGFVTAKDPDTLTVSGDIRLVQEGIRGVGIGSNARIADPDRTVNYVTCHDNYTLVDRFEAVEKNSKKITYTQEELENMNVLANAVTLTSQGTAFLQEGEEFLRSKGGESNSYGGQNDGRDYYKMNELDYSLALEHEDMVQDYKTLIALKKNLAGLHLSASDATSLEIVTDSSKKNELIYDLPDGEGRTYRICHVNGTSSSPEAVDFDGFELVYDTLGQLTSLSSSTSVMPYQTIIAVK